MLISKLNQLQNITKPTQWALYFMGMVVPSHSTTTFIPNHELGNDSRNWVFHKIAPVGPSQQVGPGDTTVTLYFNIQKLPIL